MALGQSFCYWCLYCLWRRCFGFVFIFGSRELLQLGARWAQRKRGSDTLKYVACVPQQAGCSQILQQAWEQQVDNRGIRRYWGAQFCFHFQRLLFPPTITGSPCFQPCNCPEKAILCVLSEFKSTFCLTPMYPCSSVWIWKAGEPLPVLSTLLSFKGSLSILTGHGVLPEDTAIDLAVRSLRENNFRSHFIGSQSRLLWGLKWSLFHVSIYLYLT